MFKVKEVRLSFRWAHFRCDAALRRRELSWKSALQETFLSNYDTRTECYVYVTQRRGAKEHKRPPTNGEPLEIKKNVGVIHNALNTFKFQQLEHQTLFYQSNSRETLVWL